MIKIHCNGPKCRVTVEDGMAGAEWWAASTPNGPRYDFHDERCMQAWMIDRLFNRPDERNVNEVQGHTH